VTRSQIPTSTSVIGPGIAALIAARPRTLPLVNYGAGVYSHITAGLEAQAALAIARLADGAYNGRLPLARGQALRNLAGSEFDASLDFAPTRARGALTLTRLTGAAFAGVIPKGSRFVREATTAVPVPLPGAAFLSVDDVNVPLGVRTVRVPIEATSDGAAPNSPPTTVALPALTIGSQLFDNAWKVTAYEVAGGSDGVSDDDLKRYARFYATGQYAPNRNALAAAMLAATGVKHFILVDNTAAGVGEAYVMDQSWASGADWAARVQQGIYDAGAVGFGAKVRVYPTTNRVITSALTVRLRSPNSLADTTDLDLLIKRRLRSYFDDRPDWNMWTLAAIRGVISRADKRILRCTSAAIYDETGAPLAEPRPGTYLHYYLANNGVTTTYQGPV